MRTPYRLGLLALGIVMATVLAFGTGPRSDHVSSATVIAQGQETTLAVTVPFKPRRFAVDETQNALWVPLVASTGGSRLLRINLADSQVETLALPAFQADDMHCDVAVDSSSVWIASMNSLVRVDKTDGSAKTYTLPQVSRPLDASLLPPPSPSGNVEYPAERIVEDASGSLWIARAYADSLLEFRQGEHVFVEHSLPRDFGSPEDLAFDGQQNAIWMTVGMAPNRIAHNTLGKFNVGDGTFASYPVVAAGLARVGSKLTYESTGGVITQSDAVNPSQRVAMSLAPSATVTPLDGYAFGADGRTVVSHFQSGTILEYGVAGNLIAQYRLPVLSVHPRGLSLFGGQVPNSIAFSPPPGMILVGATGDAFITIPDAGAVLMLRKPTL